MVTAKPLADTNMLLKCATEQLGCPHFCSQGIKIPVYCFGTQYLIDNSLFGGVSHISDEEQSLLDSLLLAQWEERMWKGHFEYDITASEIKVIRGRRKFLAQLNSDGGIDCLQDPDKHKMCHQKDLPVFDQTKHCEELLFCITNSDKADSELIPSAAVPNGAILIVINACYFPDLLPVEHMPVDILFDAGQKGIQISTVIDYPIKTLLFESNCNIRMMVEIVSETTRYLLDKEIPYNLMISDCGKKVFLFLQAQTLSSSCNLSAWECGGYFLFKSRQEFEEVTEAALLKRLSTVSLDDEGFATVKQFCCTMASKIVF
ncbi:GDP-L-galactose phosphorylase 1 isoform X2 [Manihot esculenta]|uniref:GDP-L-galactose phosphorylase 1 isoform X2 n=1 Tax=Manihot esculenta TaxID=3983 RepID=UPI000B5D5CFA|nr:GDP-L-galactose phosphorylase 1 isoform X2 [Manihot esculenta]